MRMGLLIVAAIALIGFLAVAVVIPQMEGSKAREAAEALIAGADPAKKQVAAAAEKAGNLAGSGKGVKVDGKGNMQWIVSDNGAIHGFNKDSSNALEITVTPALQGGKVSWNCKGYPVSAMPASCGGK